MLKHIFFDLDSTLVTIEGLDWLASRKGLKQEVAAITSATMNGRIKLNGSFRRKMDLLQPSHRDFIRLGQKYCTCFSPGALELIRKLNQVGKQVWIITGNFHPAVGMIASFLNIPPHQVIANTAFFDSRGEYRGFNYHHPLNHHGGKGKLIADLKLPKSQLAFIGDSASDLEAQDSVGLFIGYGGVVRRDIVARKSPVFVDSPSLLSLLPHLLTDQEQSIVK